MPAQDLEKSSHVLKILNMPPTIPANNSHEHLMPDGGGRTRNGDEGAADRPSTTTNSFAEVTARQWVSILILCFVNLINYMDRFTLAGILTDIQKYYDIDDGSAGLLQTSFILSYMIFAPIFGYLGDRYSRKIIMAFGVFLWCLTTLAGSFMDVFWLFTLFRALVGIGEASYSTIAPTIISDLFVGHMRSRMLAMFYFAIPVGSGLGYIVGSETAKLAGEWQFALRVTPILGAVATFLLVFVLRDPIRGESEGNRDLTTGTISEDIRALFKNPSFLLSTLGFTCVAFVAGALAWWGPKLLILGVKAQNANVIDEDSLSLIFGAITMVAGIVGLALGAWLSQTLKRLKKADPLICAGGLIVSSPFILAAMLTVTENIYVCFVCLFFGQVALNLNWAIVTDILLYVVLPTRRSTAEGFQLLFSHALGDAGSPYLIGVISTAFKTTLSSDGATYKEGSDPWVEFNSLQYALFLTCFIEVLGGLFFLVNSLYIVKDKEKVDRAIQENVIQLEAVQSSKVGPKSPKKHK